MTVDSLTKKRTLVVWKLGIHHRLHKSASSVPKSPDLMGSLSYYLYQIFLSFFLADKNKLYAFLSVTYAIGSAHHTLRRIIALAIYCCPIYNILFGNTEGQNHLEDVRVEQRIILKINP